MDIRAKFTGEMADSHMLPALEASQSIEGIARVLTVVSHYMVTGEVRKRHPFESTAKIIIRPLENGSVEALFGLLMQPDTFSTTTTVGAIGTGIASAYFKDLLSFLTNRMVGKKHEPKTDELKQLLASRSGEVDALADAIEPSIKRAHSSISNGAGQIVIISGSNNVVNFDAKTKHYINNTKLAEELETKIVSCGSLNANTRYGRVFDAEHGRTIPISVSRQAEPRTLGALADSLTRYSKRKMSTEGSEVSISYRVEYDADGVVKRYIIYDAWTPSSDK